MAVLGRDLSGANGLRLTAGGHSEFASKQPRRVPLVACRLHALVSAPSACSPAVRVVCSVVFLY